MSKGDGDKRTVNTDALATIGNIIDDREKRDAIHLAVEPCIAPTQLRPGQPVDASGNPASWDKGVGIVDPFLRAHVEAGQRFWLVIYPREIHSLRHVWTHPSFPDEPEAISPKTEAEKWIRNYAEELGLGYKRLMAGADAYIESLAPDGAEWGEYLNDGPTLEGTSTDPKFWDNYEIVRETRVLKEHRDNFFTCSC